jgi:hypothetical protein
LKRHFDWLMDCNSSSSSSKDQTAADHISNNLQPELENLELFLRYTEFFKMDGML